MGAWKRGGETGGTFDDCFECGWVNVPRSSMQYVPGMDACYVVGKGVT